MGNEDSKMHAEYVSICCPYLDQDKDRINGHLGSLLVYVNKILTYIQERETIHNYRQPYECFWFPWVYSNMQSLAGRGWQPHRHCIRPCGA